MTTTKAAAHTRHNYFSSTILDNPDRFIRRARAALKDVPFDTFVVRGMSGAIAGGMLARSMRKNLFVVRKEDDNTHDGTQPFGVMGTQGWVFLDDFISSGNTFLRSYEAVQNRVGSTSEVWDSFTREWRSLGRREVPPMVGVYTYRESDGGFMTTQEVNRQCQPPFSMYSWELCIGRTFK
jgi:orotate phosphoribosyltransferase